MTKSTLVHPYSQLGFLSKLDLDMTCFIVVFCLFIFCVKIFNQWFLLLKFSTFPLEYHSWRSSSRRLWICAFNVFGHSKLKICTVSIADSEGRTPLHWAVDRGHFDVVETLLDKNADVNAKVFIFLINSKYAAEALVFCKFKCVTLCIIHINHECILLWPLTRVQEMLVLSSNYKRYKRSISMPLFAFVMVRQHALLP